MFVRIIEVEDKKRSTKLNLEMSVNDADRWSDNALISKSAFVPRSHLIPCTVGNLKAIIQTWCNCYVLSPPLFSIFTVWEV